MFKNQSNRQKFFILTAFLAFMAVVCYPLTFAKTFRLWEDCKRMEEQKKLIKQIPEQLPIITKKIEMLENVLGSSGDVDFSSLILEQISKLCQQNNVILKEIPEKHQLREENLLVETIAVNLQGNFHNQLVIVSDLEKNDVKARLRSLRFQSVLDQTTAELQLQSTLYLQSIRLISENSNSSDHAKLGN